MPQELLSMPCDPAPAQSDLPINQFALVTYIPDALGDFLNQLRQELVPGCSASAHVTVLPPRPLNVASREAADYLGTKLQVAQPFRLGIAEIQVFDKTDVIYAEIGLGREALLDLHYELNHAAMSFIEPFPYHPHVTLAQNVDHQSVPEMFAYACRRWEEWRNDRTFLLERVTFVQNTEQNHWKDLAWYRLENHGPTDQNR
jgi:2'-5' RNA ligase